MTTDNLDLFGGGDAEAPSEPATSGRIDRDAPLAERMRPRTLDEVVGQAKVIGERGFLRRAITADRVPSLIFWGPPGTGKTTLARLIAQETSSHFLPFSAVTSGIKEIKEVMARAERLRRSRAVLLFVDEIHRFNRAQQDAFLPYVERGDVVLVGATTENPSFELNGALLSRCRVVVLEPLAPEDLRALLGRALEDAERGLGDLGRSRRARTRWRRSSSSPRATRARRSRCSRWRPRRPRPRETARSGSRRSSGWPSARCCSTTSRAKSTST
jgi:replication-associated recombination protein RarA